MIGKKRKKRILLFLTTLLFLTGVFEPWRVLAEEEKNMAALAEESNMVASLTEPGAEKPAEPEAAEPAEQGTEKPEEQDDESSVRESDYDFVVDELYVTINVSETNVLEVTELIKARFPEGRQGLYRTLPLSGSVQGEDGSFEKGNGQLEILSATRPYSLDFSEDTCYIQFGDRDQLVQGEKYYELKYRYMLENDRNDSLDIFSYNLAGAGWSTPVDNINFTVVMPKSFDPNGLSLAFGWEESAGDEGVNVNVSGNTIKGYSTKKLMPGQAAIIRLLLPDGYFIRRKLEFRILDIICYLLPIIFFIAALLLWFFFGRDDEVVETTEFCPPDDLNSMEAGYYFKGDLSDSDISSLLVWLANKGYIRIKDEMDEGYRYLKRSFRIIRLKPYDGDDLNLKLFMEGLFETKGKSTLERVAMEMDREKRGEDEQCSVTSGQLYCSFSRTMDAIRANVLLARNKIFLDRGKLMAGIFVMLVLSWVCVLLPPVNWEFLYRIGFKGEYYAAQGMVMWMLCTAFPIIGMNMICRVLLHQKIERGGRASRAENRPMKTLLWGIGMIVAPAVWALRIGVRGNHVFLYGTIVAYCCILGVILCYQFMPKRTQYGNRIKGRLKGFRSYLMTTDKAKLDRIAREDPSFFYEALPYACVFGIRDLWLSHIEEYKIPVPEWYQGNGAYDGAGEVLARVTDIADRALSARDGYPG